MDNVLIALETAGWDALTDGRGAHFYSDMLSDNAVMVSPWGVVDREGFLEGLADSPGWDSYDLADVKVLAMSADAAAVVYRAHAIRGEQTYDAYMSSTYERGVDGDWRLALHQQSPIPQDPTAR